MLEIVCVTGWVLLACSVVLRYRDACRNHTLLNQLLAKQNMIREMSQALQHGSEKYKAEMAEKFKSVR